jgi:cell division ATPase FtsA
MIGTRLETEMYLVTIGGSPAVNLRKSVERAGYRVHELVLEPLASALAVLTDDEKELGVALVELGAGTTDLAIFHEGKIRHLASITFGGGSVTNDIVLGLKVTPDEAERLKERYGCAYEAAADPDLMIPLPGTAAIVGLSDSVEGPRFATVVGLARYGAHRLALSGVSSSGVRQRHQAPPGAVDGWIERVRIWLQDFF